MYVSVLDSELEINGLFCSVLLLESVKSSMNPPLPKFSLTSPEAVRKAWLVCFLAPAKFPLLSVCVPSIGFYRNRFNLRVQIFLQMHSLKGHNRFC